LSQTRRKKAVQPANSERRDKIVASSVTGYSLFWCLLLVGGTVLSYNINISDDAWGRFWHALVIGLTSITVVTVVWFVWGGIRDLRILFKLLRTGSHEAQDDGTVSRKED
jgi:SSS family solute:Na+ symporter